MRVIAALAIAAGACAGCAGQSPHLLVESAWKEANRRAGVGGTDAPPPEVSWRAPLPLGQDCDPDEAAGPRLIARYLPDLDRVEVLSACARPIHSVLVHEFLHAIRERTRRRESGILDGYRAEGEAWVQERARASAGGRAPASARQARPDSAARSSRDPSDPSTSLR